MNWNPSYGEKIIKGWRRDKKPTSATIAIKPGNIAYIRTYNATTVISWDRSPVLLILKVSSSYVLAFNINWMTKAQKKKTLQLFTNAVKSNKDVVLNRQQQLRLFKKLKTYQFPRGAIRVYHRAELSKSIIYKLSIGEFYEAMSTNLIKIKTTA